MAAPKYRLGFYKLLTRARMYEYRVVLSLDTSRTARLSELLRLCFEVAPLELLTGDS